MQVTGPLEGRAAQQNAHGSWSQRGLVQIPDGQLLALQA